MSNDEYREQITRWLAPNLGTGIDVDLTAVDSGRVNETVIADIRTASDSRRYVVKRPVLGGAVFRESHQSEAQLLQALYRAGAAVPPVHFTDDGTFLGRPGFAMEHLAGRSVADEMLTGPLSEGWFMQSSPAAQQDIWYRFHDALADVHRLPAESVIPSATTARPIDQLSYWQNALSDIADRDAAPIQHEVLDWLSDRLPADDAGTVTVCMGDARLANGIFGDPDGTWLIDWELGRLGHPASDIAYSLSMNEFFANNAGFDAPGIPTDEQTWDRWEQRSGHRTDHRDYWTVHAGIVIAVTATRAMAAMMRNPDNPTSAPPEEFNPFAGALPALVAKADT